MIKLLCMKESKTFYFYRHKPNNKDDKYINKIYDTLTSNGYVKDDKGEYAFIFGGDGSLFHNAYDTNYTKKYCLINCGHLGFFADYNVDNFSKEIEKNINFIEEQIPCYKLTTNKEEINFVNDIYIVENRPVEIEILVNSVSIIKQKANGVALGTSVGSSGYLYSLGSPLVLTNKSVLQFSLLAPIRNKTSNNFITKGILSSDDIVEIKLSNDCTVFHDGIKLDYSVNKLLITQSKKKMTLVHLKSTSNLDRIIKSFK